MLKLCVAGATGRMGNAIIAEATAKGHQITGAIEAPNNPSLGKTLQELGITNSETKIVNSEKLSEALANADVYISFTSPAAELTNIPIVANLGKRIILGTTGFTAEQSHQIVNSMTGKVPAVFSPNYSVGVNILFKLAESLKAFPQGYDFSINEIHHTGKKDAPSGTAKRLGEIVSNVRGYSKGSQDAKALAPAKLENSKLLPSVQEVCLESMT